jgi:hypothetical protein
MRNSVQEKLGLSVEICHNLTGFEVEQKLVQQHVSDYEALYSSISFAPK